MREGWKIRKLGDIGTIVGGSTPKTNIPEYWGEGYPWITPAELNGSKYVNATERTITEEALKHTNLTLLPVGSVLLSSRAPIGKVAITTIPLYCNQGFKNIVCGPGINNEYVYWFLIHRKEYLISLGRGATFKEISKHIVEQVPILVPPVQEQEKIVAELDCLTDIIEKKKQQLKELDNLAQSIFYDMFGDPITNEKKWELQPFGKVYRLKSGDGLKEKDFAGGDYPVYGGNGISGYHNLFNKSGKHIIIGRVGAYCGNVRFVQGDFWLTDNAFDASFDDTITDYLYACFLLNTLNLHQYANHAAQPVISNAGLKEVPIIIPPIDLQNAFAQKIEAIEKQKELIKKSIQETETLFNSRMDYWFN